MKGHIVPLSIALLLGVAIFTSFRYVRAVTERQNMLDSLTKVKNQLSQLESDRETLNQRLGLQIKEKEKLDREKRASEEQLKDSRQRYSVIETQLSQTQQRIEELNLLANKLEQENISLRENRDNLAAQAEQLAKEKSILEKRLSSIEELKKAMGALKTQMRQARAQLREKIKQPDKITEGNRGYLIKNGKTTYPTTVTIKVIPAPLK